MADTGVHQWHLTNAVAMDAPLVWRFTAAEVTKLLLCVGLGFGVFLMMTGADFGFLSSLVSALVLPGLRVLFSLTLVCGKPAGHARDWLEWRILKATGRALIESRPNLP